MKKEKILAFVVALIYLIIPVYGCEKNKEQNAQSVLNEDKTKLQSGEAEALDKVTEFKETGLSLMEPVFKALIECMETDNLVYHATNPKFFWKSLNYLIADINEGNMSIDETTLKMYACACFNNDDELTKGYEVFNVTYNDREKSFVFDVPKVADVLLELKDISYVKEENVFVCTYRSLNTNNMYKITVADSDISEKGTEKGVFPSYVKNIEELNNYLY